MILRLLLISFFFVLLENYAQSTEKIRFTGPFRAEALAFFFIHDGGPLKIGVDATPDENKEAGKILCRFYDAAERLVHGDYQKLPPNQTKHIEYDYGADAPAGIYQIRYSGRNLKVEVRSVPASSFGVMPSRCMMKASSVGQFENVWFKVPENVDSFSIRGFGVKGEVFDPSGKIVVKVGRRPETIDIPKLDAKRIGRLSLRMTPDFYSRFGVSGMPFIMCPSLEIAKRINGSLEKSNTGVFYPHKFQIEMIDWMTGLTRKELELTPFDLKKYEKELLADPYSAGLFGGWGFFKHLPYIIRSQDIDPNSPDFGKCANITALALAYTLDKPYNPYFQNPVLEKRILLGAFHVLSRLKEDDTFDQSDNNYAGGDALSFFEQALPFYFAGGKIANKALGELWFEGVRRMPERFAFSRASCENQSSHWPVMLTCLFNGSGEEIYKQLAADYIKELSTPENNPFMRTGYQQEAYGPDATYQGLGACMQAVYFRMTKDVNALNGLRTIYDFLNHTVAPEPDGTIYGASNFSHRTAGSWVNRQYNGGLPLMKGILEEAAVWYPPKKTDKSEFVKCELKKSVPDSLYERAPQLCGYSSAVFSPLFHDYLFPSKTLVGAKLPVEKAERFTKNFNNEFIAIRRPAYYAIAYVGKTAAEWTRKSVKFQSENPKPVYKWNQIQGLSMFWTPNYGNCVLSMNWNANTPQMIRADLENGKCDFPDYWSLKSKFDQATMTLSTDWTMHTLPISIKRNLHFGETKVDISVTLTFSAAGNVESLYEQIPFLIKSGSKVEFKNDSGEWQTEPCDTPEVRFINQTGKGVLFQFDQPHKYISGPESELNHQKMGTLRVSLPNKFNKDETCSLSYSITPFDVE